MGFSDVSQLRAAVLATEPGDFVSRHLFEPVPYVFMGDLDLWVNWKTRLARHLDVDPYEIVLTGSGAVGFSLNPHKAYSSFHQGSDIDVGVISLHYFEVSWRYLRQLRPSWLSLPRATKNAIDMHRKRHVFGGSIATDRILPLLPFGKPWQAGLDEMATLQPTIGRSVKIRIYRDYDALRVYQSEGLRRLRDELLEEVEVEPEPLVEET